MKFWIEKWQSGVTPWDLGKPHPLLEPLLQAAIKYGTLNNSANIYIPGCGRAHEGAYLASLGYKVVAEDLAKEAIDEAVKLYAKVDGLTLQVGDAFKVAEESVFNAIFDRAVLCAFRPEDRAKYFETCAKRLKSGGVFMGLPFTKLNIDVDNGPPYALSKSEIQDLMAKDFELCHFELRADGGVLEVVREEALLIARKK